MLNFYIDSASIFAYGQTSSGKTYTMTGITEYTVADIYDYIKRVMPHHVLCFPFQSALIFCLICFLFDSLLLLQHPERAFSLKLSAIEIYNEAVRDLLSLDGTPLRLLDDPEV